MSFIDDECKFARPVLSIMGAVAMFAFFLPIQKAIAVLALLGSICLAMAGPVLQEWTASLFLPEGLISAQCLWISHTLQMLLCPSI